MKRVALAAGLILIAATAFSFGSSERVTVHGTIHVTGNDPHTFLILRTDNGDTYRLEGTLADELRRALSDADLQHDGETIPLTMSIGVA